MPRPWASQQQHTLRAATTPRPYSKAEVMRRPHTGASAAWASQGSADSGKNECSECAGFEMAPEDGWSWNHKQGANQGPMERGWGLDRVPPASLGVSSQQVKGSGLWGGRGACSPSNG